MILSQISFYNTFNSNNFSQKIKLIFKSNKIYLLPNTSLENSKKNAIALYNQMLTSNSFDEIYDIQITLIREYNLYIESFYGYILLFGCLEYFMPTDYMKAAYLFFDFCYWFGDSSYSQFVARCMARYLIKLSIKDGNNEFIDICNSVLDILKDKELYTLLVNKKYSNIFMIIENAIEAGQLNFAFDQLNMYLNIEETKSYALIMLIRLYQAMNLVDEYEKHLELLKKTNYSLYIKYKT